MTKTRLVASLFLALALLPTATRVDAQIGGLIKKKVTEKVKGGGDKKDQPAASNSVKTDESKLPRKLTEVVLASFKKGLEVERDQRQATVKILAAVKTREQYNSCQQTLAAGPEMQKLVMSLGNMPENATTDQIQKAQQKMYADMAKLLTDKCGEDPSKYNDSWRRQQMEAAELAGVKTFSHGIGTSSGSGGPFLSFDEQPADDADLYRLLKEWIPIFCNLSKEAQQKAADNGVAVPGSGQGIAYVYTAFEAKLLMPLCAEIMRLLSDVQ
jgi:hypothetical protein